MMGIRFWGVKRKRVAGGGCPDTVCEAGSDACDWKTGGILACAPDPYYVEMHVC